MNKISFKKVCWLLKKSYICPRILQKKVGFIRVLTELIRKKTSFLLSKRIIIHKSKLYRFHKCQIKEVFHGHILQPRQALIPFFRKEFFSKDHRLFLKRDRVLPETRSRFKKTPPCFRNRQQ